MIEKTTAILSRTNLGLRIFESLLTEQGIKYHLVGRAGYWSQPEVRSVLSYLSCAWYPSDAALGGAIRAPFWPSKFLPKSKLCARLKELKDDCDNYWHFLTKEPWSLVENKNLSALQDFTRFVGSLVRYRDLKAGEAVKQILMSLRAYDYLAEEEACIDNDPVLNIKELEKTAARFATLKEFLDYCRKVTAASKSKTGIALSTIHGAKGLEFHTVYVVQCSEGVLPHVKSTDLDGERNCFFVGASRAERELILTYSGRPSIFLEPYLKNVVESETKGETCESVPKIFS
jgi:DNA helicase-2/ATP-dependent DNA helicase PcrA